MKKKPFKLDWTRFAAAAGALILLLIVFYIGSAAQGSYEDAGKTELSALNDKGSATLISSGRTVWKYLDEGQDQAVKEGNQTQWRKNQYEASGWKEAVGSFGAKDGERKELGNGNAPNNLLNQYQEDGSCAPVYLFRTELTIANPESIGALKGKIEFDDAVLIYINGELVWTGNVPDGGYADLLEYGAKEGIANTYDEEFIIKDTSMLKKGKNTVAVEVHQDASSSSDIYFDMHFLRGISEKKAPEKLDASGLILEVGEDEKSVKVNWYTDQKGSFQILYSEETEGKHSGGSSACLMGRRTGGTTHVYCYTANLPALKVDTEYSYRIQRIASEDMSESYSFKTAGAENGFTFLFAGDPQIGAENTEDDSAKWNEVLEKSTSLIPDAAFLISAGDQTDSSDKERAKQQYFGFRRPEILKVLPVAVNRGNHEIKTGLYEKQFKRSDSEEMEYSFVYKNVLFIALDSLAGSLEQQADFLRSEIKNHQADWIVVTMHYSLFSAGSHADDEGIIRRREYFAPIFSECGVDLVLAGHDHSYTRTFYMDGLEATENTEGKKKDGEVLYITGGSSTGNKYYDKTETDLGYVGFFMEEEVPVMTSVTIDGGSLEIKTFNAATGEKVDSCIIKK